MKCIFCNNHKVCTNLDWSCTICGKYKLCKKCLTEYCETTHLTTMTMHHNNLLHTSIDVL